MQIDLIAGTRPNFVKISAIIHAIQKNEKRISFRLIHTGQHYDSKLSDSFFRELNIPAPSINFEVGSGSQAFQTAKIMMAYEKLLNQSTPDVCIVVGDVTSSMACAIAAKKKNIKLAHVEAGIRSNDWGMPEEVNRVLIDSISDYFFTTTQKASDFLISTGKLKKDVYFVGNTMIDSLLRFEHKFNKPSVWDMHKLENKKYIVLTLHRPSNVDQISHFKNILTELCKHSQDLPILFPAHPRTQSILDTLNFKSHNLHIIEPLSYLEFNYLVKNSLAVFTDSGGITEETTVLNVPCITFRDTTERPETIEIGTNLLIGTDPKSIAPAFEKLFNNNWKKGKIPKLWDGKAGDRIVQKLLEIVKL